MSAPDIAVGFLGEPTLAEAGLVDVEERIGGSTTHRFQSTQTIPTRRSGEIASTAAGDFRRWSTRYVRALLALDSLIGLAAVAMSTAFATATHPQSVVDWLLLGTVGVVAWPVLLAAAQAYNRRRLGLGAIEVLAVMRAAVAVVVLCALPAAWFGLHPVLNTAAIAVPAAAIGSLVLRCAASRRLHTVQRTGGRLRRIIVVGSPEAVQDLCTALDREHDMGMQTVAVCVPSADVRRAREMGLPTVGDVEHVATLARELGCQAVAVTGAGATRQGFLRQLAWSLEGTDVDLLVQPGLIEVARPRMQIQPWTAVPMLHVELPRFAGWRRWVKRATDIVLTSIGLVLISPFLAAIALAVKLDDRRGPVIFRQQRVGIDGKPFTMYKFRSMVADAEQRLAQLRAKNQGAGPLFKMEHDPRITRIGRFLRKYSLDELPQLFNVLLGSMSLVGPRPPLQSEVDEYAEDIRRRLKVIPGLTGLWQVSGRSMLSWEDSVRLDLRYVENWSMLLDLQILWKTVFAVLAKQGAY